LREIMTRYDLAKIDVSERDGLHVTALATASG
jgi:hypothetical protein